MSVPAVSLANTDPTENLTKQWGQLCSRARQQTDALTTTLRTLDKIRATLAESNLTVAEDLGPIGNAAAAARRDLEKRRDEPTFKMPPAS